MSSPPFLSLIIPTHKRPHLLRRALSSIKNQPCPGGIEIIVVSDINDGPTAQVCTDLLGPEDIYIRRNGPPGPSASRNLALSLASGHFVMFLDDDDAWHPGLAAQLHQHFSIHSARAVFFNCSVVTERRSPNSSEELSEVHLNMAGRLTPEVFIKNQVHMSCFVFPRTLLDGLTFDTTMRAYEDWDYQLTVFERQFPEHIPILGSRIFEVRDESSDRRGSSQQATDFNAVLDYLYVYRRHSAPSLEIAQRRSELLNQFNLSLDARFL